MEPIGYGFLIMIAGAVTAGIVIGALGGAISWRLNSNLVLGAVLTAVAFPLLLIADDRGSTKWLRAELHWGLPSLALGFLSCALLATSLRGLTRIGPTWAAILAFVLAVGLGVLSMRSLKNDPGAIPTVGLVADACLLALLVFARRRFRR